MDSSVAEPCERNDIELGPVTHWPTVYAAIGVGAVVFIGLAAVGLLAALQPAPPPETTETVAAVVPAPPPRPVQPARVKAAEAAPVAPTIVAKQMEPEPAVVVAPPAPTRDAPTSTAVTPIIRPAEAVVMSPAAPSIPDPPAPPPKVVQRSALGYDVDLLAALQTSVKEISLSAEDSGSVAALAKTAAQNRRPEPVPDPSRRRLKSTSPEPADALLDLIVRRPDLAGLPVRGKSECRISDEAAEALGLVSARLRQAQARILRSRGDKTIPVFLDAATSTARDENLTRGLSDDQWFKAENVPGLVQVLQADTPAVRIQLTRMLTATKGPEAGAALARLALFDLSPEVRENAVVALKDREPEEYRSTLLKGFRYPWPPVADHAAYALTTLADRWVIPELLAMKGLPDPAAPTLDAKKTWVKAELVKVNHLRNCLLCHAPSTSEEDPVRGFIPKPGEAIPVMYYGNPEGNFVRADVTYLRQDFSLLEAVPEPADWPGMQRFDYLVRRRKLTDVEIKDMAQARDQAAPTYPQREAVLFALEKLTRPDDARPVEKVGLGP